MKIATILALLILPLTASAAVYKCDEGGHVVYMDRPCMYAVKDVKPAVTPVSAERRERSAPLRAGSLSEEVAVLAARPLSR